MFSIFPGNISRMCWCYVQAMMTHNETSFLRVLVFETIVVSILQTLTIHIFGANMKVRESNSVILLNAGVQISTPDRLKNLFYKLGSEQFLETNRNILFTSLGEAVTWVYKLVSRNLIRCNVIDSWLGK